MLDNLEFRTRVRLLVLGIILLLVVPTAIAGLTYSEPTEESSVSRQNAENVTFISIQGQFESTNPGGRLVAVHTDTRDVLWVHDEYQRYFDVDVLDEDHVLFLAEIPDYSGNGSRMHAHVANWRNGTILYSFQVPGDTHDVDYLGDDQFAVADKENHRAYVYDRSTDEVVWEYSFYDDYSVRDDGGPVDDWTHLNDIDPVANGSAFLVSPRNFDRVMLINRTKKEVVWTLGQENNYEILNEQHNPDLISTDPPTVLVSDSENHRIIEYRRTDGSWEPIWVYEGSLRWPRDADRLPNGNTLIVDSVGDRVVEVTPDRQVVWEYHTAERHPYDVERLEHHDDPREPSMVEYRDQFDEPFPSDRTSLMYVSSLRGGGNYLFQLATWILPVWVGYFEFFTLLGAVLLGLTWAGTEVALAVPESVVTELSDRRFDAPTVRRTSAALGVVLGVITVIAAIAPNQFRSGIVGIGWLLVTIGWNGIWNDSATTEFRRRIHLFGSIGFAATAVPVAALLFTRPVADTTLLYYGLGVLVLWQAVYTWQNRPRSDGSDRSEP